jgi:predicted DNA-binding transcriptional regulator YafY
VVKDFIWYLVACNEDNHTIRTYRCERIVKCVLLPEKFNLPNDFSIKKYFRSSLKKFKEERRESEQFPVTILINKQDLPLIRNCEVFSSRQIGDDMEVVMNMYSQENALNNFWNVMIRAEVINPRELKLAVMNKLRSKLQRRKLPVENRQDDQNSMAPTSEAMNRQ